MPINEEYIFTYEDYLAIKYDEGMCCIEEADAKYILETDFQESDDCKIEAEQGLEEKGIHQTHDKSFKDVLSDKEEMAFLLREFVGIEVEAGKLQEYKNEFITKQYGKKQADIIYRNTEKEIYYIVEHQSSKDQRMPERIAEYCFELMENAIKNSSNEVYPTIVPIVLYTGRGKWNIETNFAERQKYSIGSYLEYKIDIKYKVVDINKIKDIELLEKQNYLANVMLMEKCKTYEEKMNMLVKMHEEMKNKEEKDKILYYFVNVYGQILKPEDKKRLNEELERSEDKMTVLQQTMIKEREALARENRAKGREEGRTEGRAKGRAEVARNLLKIKMPIEQIIEVTGLERKEIEKLKEKA